MYTQRPRHPGWRLWPFDTSYKRSLVLFILGLALQVIIVLSAMPGKAQVEPSRSPVLSRSCFPHCTTIMVDSFANTIVSGVYTSTYSIDINPITKTIVIGELSGADAEYLSVQVNQGSPPSIHPMTDVWNADKVFLPIVLTTTVQALEAGIHTQTLGRYISATRVAEAQTTIMATADPLSFTWQYGFLAVTPVGVVTDTYFIAPGTDAITQTNVMGEILTGTYRLVVGSDQTSCVIRGQGFSCTVPDLAAAGGAVITASVEVQEPGSLVRDVSVSGAGERLPLTLTTTLQPPPFIPVIIDIKPGGEPNSINPKSRGNIPVAILSTADFHVVDHVAVDTLTFGPTGEEASQPFCKPEDANGDGLLDLVCHFDTLTTNFESGDRVGRLTGKTISGEPILGEDSVRIVPR
jgi:hypothetical protein